MECSDHCAAEEKPLLESERAREREREREGGVGTASEKRRVRSLFE